MPKIRLFDEEAIRAHRRSSKNEYQMAKTFTEIGCLTNRIHLRKWLIGIIIFLLTYLIAINSVTLRQFRIVPFTNNTNIGNYVEIRPHFSAVRNSGFLVRNKGCRIPALDPFDPAIQKYVEKASPIKCDYGSYLPLIESNNTAIFVNSEAKDYFYNKTELVDCCWLPLWRSQNEDNAVTFGKDCHHFQDSATITEEFIKVICSKNNKVIYRDYHAFLPRKPKVETRCHQMKKPVPETPHLSILIVGLDAISRLNFHRTMPKTVRSLQDLGAVEMVGYNKVADNTFPNLIPVLSGFSKKEFQNICWTDHKKPFDPCPFIWKDFSSAGFRTIFGEDACNITTFNYLKPGFKIQPTDYYLRPFCLAAENDIGNTFKLNTNLCLGTKKSFETLLQYTHKVASEFENDPYFAFFWQSSLSHDFLEFPQLGDDSYRDFIKSLQIKNLLKKTALIVMSDHGLRWGSFRQTYQGRLEDSLPFVFLVLPDWWKETFPVAWGNLRRNSRSLTTPFDLHETLKDLLNPQRLMEEMVRKRIEDLSQEIPRGISWFLPIPDHRTCTMADIPGHWCMCHGSNNISLTDPNLRKSVKFLIKELNEMVKKYPQCAVLKLKRVIDAKMWSDKEKGEEGNAPWIDFTTTLETQPGGAIFEGSVRYRTDNGKMKLIGSVSRLNAYGKQSACVDDFNMRLYCYCL